MPGEKVVNKHSSQRPFSAQQAQARSTQATVQYGTDTTTAAEAATETTNNIQQPRERSAGRMHFLSLLVVLV
jgi:hypothetical protein